VTIHEEGIVGRKCFVAGLVLGEPLQVRCVYEGTTDLWGGKQGIVGRKCFVAGLVLGEPLQVRCVYEGTTDLWGGKRGTLAGEVRV